MKTAKIIPFKRPKLSTDPFTDAMLRAAWTPWLMWAESVSMMFNFWRQK